MATRSNIAIHIKPSMRNSKHFTPWGVAIDPEGNEYLQIYCHNDGYPSGVGSSLEKFKEKEDKTYLDMFDYILMGDRSTANNSYYEWRNEKSNPMVLKEPLLHEEYLYLIDYVSEDSDDWVVKVFDEDKSTFVNVTEHPEY